MREKHNNLIFPHSSKHDKNLKKQTMEPKKYLLPIINNRITRTTFLIEFDKFEALFAWMGFNSLLLEIENIIFNIHLNTNCIHFLRFLRLFFQLIV